METPLVIEGVHGCGKTYTALTFSESSFPDHAYIDLTKDRIWGSKDGRSPEDVLSEMSGRLGRRISGDMLLVIDGIHVLRNAQDFIDWLEDEEPCAGVICISSRVGMFRDAVRMNPMTFSEYLLAKGEDELAELLPDDPFCDAVCEKHGRLLSMYREYWAVGGLPAAVSEWIETGDERKVDEEIRHVVDGILADTAMNAPKLYDTVADVLESIPGQLSGRNRKFMFAHAIPGARSKTILDSIEWLESLDVVHRVRISETVLEPEEGWPAAPNFKLYLFDTGVLRLLSGIHSVTAIPWHTAGKDAVTGYAENHAVLELLRHGAEEMVCWRSGNKAEVAFVLVSDDTMYPIQLNVGKMAFTRSLSEFMKRYPEARPLYMSGSPPSLESEPAKVPFYAACSCPCIGGCLPNLTDVG